MKVDRALRLLPGIEAMAPVRALLLASGSAEAQVSTKLGGNDTVGRRDVTATDMRLRMVNEFRTVVGHLGGLYEAYFSAIDALDAGAPEAAVRHLVGAGHAEQKAGRVEQAHVWYRIALDIAEALVDRKPEIETLLALGGLTRWLGFHDESTRRYRRALVLAESVFDNQGAIRACQGLGTLLMEQEAWAGAEAWVARAMRLAERIEDEGFVGLVSHQQGELARRRGDFDAAATALRRAQEKFEELGNAIEMARVLTTRGLLDAEVSSATQAEATYHEALAWVRKAKGDDALEVFIRLNYARLHVGTGRFHEAEAEIRRAERLAVKNNLLQRLVQLYTLLGNLRARQGDDAGFVFFEQALLFARMLDRRPTIEARVYHEYGVFKLGMHQPEDGRAYLRRARDMFESLGLQADAERVEVDMERSTA